jgi:hypothetical protein
MTATQGSTAPRPDAVVWIDEHHAIVAQTSPAGIATTEIRRRSLPEPRFLAQIVRALGAREHVMVVGPADVRLALEREYVAISHRPDRLMAPPRAARSAGAEIVVRMDRLAA